MNNPQSDIGLQPYDESGDAKDNRFTIKCFDRMMSQIDLSNTKALLDVGCGNGRLNLVHSKYFKNVVGIDKFRAPDQKYCCHNFEFRSADLFEVNEKFSAILFMGSFYLHHYYGYIKTLSQAKNLLEPSGRIIIIDDKIRNKNSKYLLTGYYNLNDMCSELGLKIVQSFIQDEDYLSINVIGIL